MATMNLLIATTNPSKLREYGVLLAAVPANLLSLREVGLENMDVEETADTYEGNAELKALAYAQAARLVALADDSGLSVDALGGRPGLHSARYAGKDADDKARYTKLLAELEGVPDERRTARFTCAISVADPVTLRVVTRVGTVDGRIAHQPGKLLHGFGYEPVFIPGGYDAVFSELPVEIKHSLSHRASAARQIVPILQQMAQERGE